MAKPGYETERKRQLMLEKEGWFVLRVSGSIGAMDLIAVKPNGNMFDVKLEQVKKCSGETFYLGDDSKWEWSRLYEIQKNTKIPCSFVINFKIKNRRVFVSYPINQAEPPKKIRCSSCLK